MKPICVKCQRFFRPKRNGFCFSEGAPVHPTAKPGLEEPEKWRPYKVWLGDLWECPGCGSQIVSGTGIGPVAVQHQERFLSHLLDAEFQVNDC